MKITLLVLFLVVLTNFAFPQHIKFNWQNCFEKPGEQQDTYPASIISTGDGYFILCDAETDIMMPPPYNYPSSDIWLIKTDLDGNFLWEKYFGGSYEEDAVKIIPAGNDNFYIFGSTGSTDGGATIPPYLPDGGLWVIKIDAEGNKIWDRVAGNPIPIYGYGADCIATNDFGLITRVNTVGNGGDVSVSYGGFDTWLLKINAEGNIEWDFTLGTDGPDFGGSPIQTSDSGYLVPGYSFPGAIGNIVCDSSLQYTNISRAILTKLDADRNIQWQQCLGATESIYFQKAIEVNDGYIVAGLSKASDGALEGAGYHIGYNHTGSATQDLWLRKVDFEGNMIWQKCYGGSNNENVNQLFLTTDGNLMVFGMTDSYNGDVTGLHYDPHYPTFASYDIWMLKVNGSNGDLLWNRCMGDRGDERIENGCFQLNDKNYVLATGSEIGQLDDILCGPYPSLKQFAWVYSITDTTAYLGEPEMRDLSKLLRLYPNPATDYIALEIPPEFDMKHTIAEITDIAGRKMQSIVLSGNKPYLYTGDLPAGLYLLRLINKQGFVSKRFVKN